MKKYISLIISFAFGFFFMTLGILWQNPSEASGLHEWILLLSNACLVPGILLTGIGFLLRIADENLFAGVHYAFSSILTHLRGGKKRYDTYYDYLHREKKKKSPTLTLLLPGFFFLTAAACLTAAFYF